MYASLCTGTGAGTDVSIKAIIYAGTEASTCAVMETELSRLHMSRDGGVHTGRCGSRENAMCICGIICSVGGVPAGNN
jgi:hypothetical protein